MQTTNNNKVHTPLVTMCFKTIVFLNKSISRKYLFQLQHFVEVSTGFGLEIRLLSSHLVVTPYRDVDL